MELRIYSQYSKEKPCKLFAASVQSGLEERNDAETGYQVGCLIS